MTRPLFWKRLAEPRPLIAATLLFAGASACLGFAAVDDGFGVRSWALAAGIVFGIALQRGELSLVRAWRDYLVLRDSGQLLGFLTALAVAAALTLGGLALAGATQPLENARIGPVSWLLPVSAFVFGVGSVIARGGVMVHMRRLGEGSLVAAPALLATFGGFVLGLALWPWSWRVAIGDAPAPSLPAWLGMPGALAAQAAIVAAIAAALWARRPRREPDPRSLATRLAVEPWPAPAAGALLGALVAASYAVGEPLGLIAECVIVARWIATALHLAPVALPGLDVGVGGLRAPLEALGLTEHVVILLGFMVGAAAAALSSGRFALAGFTRREAAEMCVGGALLGWGAMTSLGAVTGEAIAGVAIGALSGWVFLVFASLGIVAALRLDWRTSVTAPPPEAHDAPEDHAPYLPGEPPAKQAATSPSPRTSP